MLLIIGILSFFSIEAQPSDLLILKKNNRTLQTFFPGNEIFLNTTSGYYSGVIQSINHDSLFLIQYDVRQIPTNLGVYMLDTVATYHFAINYKEIKGFGTDRNKNLVGLAPAVLLFGGGLLINNSWFRNMVIHKTQYPILCKPLSCGGLGASCRHWISSCKIRWQRISAW